MANNYINISLTVFVFLFFFSKIRADFVIAEGQCLPSCKFTEGSNSTLESILADYVVLLESAYGVLCKANVKSKVVLADKNTAVDHQTYKNICKNGQEELVNIYSRIECQNGYWETLYQDNLESKVMQNYNSYTMFEWTNHNALIYRCRNINIHQREEIITYYAHPKQTHVSKDEWKAIKSILSKYGINYMSLRPVKHSI